MIETDVISLSSDTSRPSSPFINASELFNDTETCNASQISLGLLSGKKNDLSIREEGLTTKTSSLEFIPIKGRLVHTLSDSDNSETDRPSPTPRNTVSFLNAYKNEDQSENADNYQNEDYAIQVESKLSSCLLSVEESVQKSYSVSIKRKGESNIEKKMAKERRLEEKLKKQREKDMIKAEKLAAKELQKQIKPGFCIKYMTVILDSTLVTCPFGGTLIATTQSSESKYKILTQSVPYTVSWTRDLLSGEVKDESDVVVIWQWQLFIPAVKNHTLCSQIQEIQSQSPGKSVTLVIYSLNGYFSYLKSKRRNNSEEHSKVKKRRNVEGEDYPYVTRKDIEEELIKLQILVNCNHRVVESQEDLGQLIVQITKAIAETPFKLDKQKRELENLEWFAVGDSRDCVTVDKTGNGLLRLWQQQLCQFNMAGHDTAQAIAAVYPSPTALVKAYDKCTTQKAAEELLKDIPVRRCQGPLSSSRRIGPELSKKIYIFFTSVDGEAPLSQEH